MKCAATVFITIGLSTIFGCRTEDEHPVKDNIWMRAEDEHPLFHQTTSVVVEAQSRLSKIRLI